MRIDPLLPRQSSDCIVCPDPIPCNCAANQVCFQINRDCYSCSQTKCVARDTPTDGASSGGVSTGALAGGIVGAILFLIASILLYLWFRRRSRLSPTPAVEAKPDIPAPAETVLNRPDPIEKLAAPPADPTVRVHSSSADTTVDLDAEPSQAGQNNAGGAASVISNPFTDNLSLRSSNTEGTNVIPIALIAPDPHRVSTTRAESDTLPQHSPVRPSRSPELNLNLEHVNVSRDTLRVNTPGYAASQISGISSRNSYMSSASYSSDLLSEAPMIVTPTRGAVRQVLGVVKAEVINAPPTPLTPDGLKPPSISSRPSIGSPLAATSFGPADVVHEVDESQEVANPFSDAHSTSPNYDATSPVASITTFGQPSPRAAPETRSNWGTHNSNSPWTSDDASRPSSMNTQAGSVMDHSYDRTSNSVLVSTLKAQHRSTLSRTDPAPDNQYRASISQTLGLADPKRVSASSVMSATSTRADSILESFPFVPPSPISNRPARTPPVSPLGQQSFTAAPSSPLAQQVFTNSQSPALKTPTGEDFNLSSQAPHSGDDELPTPPDRRMLGLSTASQFSTASSGLGSFPFHIDPGTGSLGTGSHQSLQGRQRASLDTLALTSDLSSYPLGFERDSIPPLPKQSSGSR
ncbi:hypothetical protein AX16_003210 [Volvariella volvacea WC 439]|nr:hypothetical protein AX16_003210 [Volvariella volvacea WC 439]